MLIKFFICSVSRISVQTEYILTGPIMQNYLYILEGAITANIFRYVKVNGYFSFLCFQGSVGCHNKLHLTAWFLFRKYILFHILES